MDYLQAKEQIKQKLPNPIDFKDTENLLELGLSSLVIMRLVNQWRKQGIKVSFGSLMEHPTFQEWWGVIQKAAKKTTAKKSKSSKGISTYRRTVRLLGWKRRRTGVRRSWLSCIFGIRWRKRRSRAFAECVEYRTVSSFYAKRLFSW